MNLSDLKSYQLYISDATEIKLLSIPEKLRVSLAETWCLPKASIQNSDATYRFINYLTSTGLLDDRREIAGKGWRKFSYVECIYLNIVVSLRKFGVKVEAIKPVYEFFSQQYDEPRRAAYLGLGWLDALIAVHAGEEIELLFQEDGLMMVCDPPMMRIIGTGATKGSLRISLSSMVNQLREANGMQLIQITNSFGELPLSSAEVGAVSEMHDLKNNKGVLHIKRTAKGTMLEKDITEEANDMLSDKINDLLKEDFGSVLANKRQGKVVNVKKTVQTLYND